MNYYVPQNSSTQPSEITQYANGESIDFCVKAKRASSFGTAMAGFIFGLLWTGFTSIFVAAFFGPLFFGKDVHIKVNGRPVVASLDNLEPLLIPAIFIGIFMLIGLVILFFSVMSFFKEGPWILATPQRLLTVSKGEVKSYDWEQFTGSTTLKGNNVSGEVVLEMRTGRMVSRKNGPDRYVPDRLYMVSIPDAVNIEQMCRQRIKEHDPTPANTTVKKQIPDIV